jgi:PAS domain S-box-containing protein
MNATMRVYLAADPVEAMLMTESVPVAERVGAFRYLSAEQRWVWSDAVARMHGYTPGEVVPTTEIVRAHKHPEDAARVSLVIDRMLHGEPFSSRHRIVDTRGATHHVLVVGDRIVDAAGTVVGNEGFYVDLTEFDAALDEEIVMDVAVAEFATYRACIEQAKGMLMITYDISAERAFDILKWRSQVTNTKLRHLAAQLLADFTAGLEVGSAARATADHLLLTTHTRLEGHADTRRSAC